MMIDSVWRNGDGSDKVGACEVRAADDVALAGRRNRIDGAGRKRRAASRKRRDSSCPPERPRLGIPAACSLAAAFLVVFAAGLALFATPAQAQTTIWSATLTPRVTSSGTPVPLGCDNTSTGNIRCSDSNTLSDADFTDDGTDYEVTKFFTKDGGLTFRLDTGATAATQGLTLVIDGEEFVLKEADRINGAKTQWKWNNTTLPGWTAGTDVAVSLVVTDAPATGQPTISGGGQVSKTLTAATDDIEDPNGLPTTPTFTYQWVRVDGSTDTDIPGAASETYTLTASDLGKQIKVKVSFTDSRGHAEGPLTSDAYPRNGTVTVVVLPGPCPAVNDWCATMTVADAEGDGRLLGYEYDKFGSLDDDQIEYGDEEFNVWTVHTYKQLSRAYFYFGSIPRVPRGTVVTVGEHTFTTDMESDDGSTGDIWHYPAGELPPGLVWPDGQEVRVSLVLGSSPPRLSIADASAAENDGHLMFDVTLSPASPHTVKVDFETTSGGTATEGVDYWPHVYTHVIPYGETTTQMGFALIEDAVNAAGETVMVRLSNAREFDAYGNVIRVLNIAAAEATGTITAPTTTTTTTNVPGLTIGIRDATGDEDDGYLDFKVRLSRKSTDLVCYDFETISGGTATEGTDYLKLPKAMYWMQIGKKVDKPFVRIIDDRVNDNGETVMVKISNARLCNDASQTLEITRAEATGTIRNTDPLPRALMARFGRTAAVHVVERVEERMAAPREAGFEAQFAGRQLRPGMERELARDFLSQLGSSAGMHAPGAGSPGARYGSPMGAGAGSIGLAAGMGGPAGGGMGLAADPINGMAGPDGGLFDRGLRSMGLGGENLLTNSSFALTRETRQGGILSFWSRGARSSFAGREEALSLGGDVRTMMFGADYAKGPLVTGLSLSNSRGLGEYAGVTAGQVASAVTGLYPWLGYKLSDRVSVWGVTGYGKGALTLTPGAGAALTSGLSMAMAAAGTRGALVAGGASGFELAFKADALWVGTSIDGVEGPGGNLTATAAAVTRFRTGLEGARNYTLAGRLSLRPSVEVGLRHDDGDAETGAGMDLGGGLVMSDASTGLGVDLRVRTLVMHQADGFSERGMALSLSYNPTPSTPLGFTARVAPSWGGEATSGAEAMWGRETMAGLANGGLASGNRLDGEVGYGLPVGSRLVGTPRVGFSTSEYGRDYRIGYGLGVLDRERLNLDLGVDAHRRESPMLDGTDNGFLGRATLGW